MRSQDIACALAASLAAFACFAGGGRPEPLYPSSEQPLSSEQVATLTGYVKFVDGKDVSSLGGSFELLPGCHVIETPSHWGVQSADGTTGVTANTGRLTFVLPMRAAYQYRIGVNTGTMTAPMGSLTIKGYESDLAGKPTREFDYSRSPKDIEACQTDAAR